MNNNGGHGRFQSIRKFFSSDRSSRSSQSSKSSTSKETNLPRLSPQPPTPTSTSPNQLGTGDTLSHAPVSKTRSLRDSAKRKLISVETNLRVITGQPRSVSPGSCISSSSSSCGSGLWNSDKLETPEDGPEFAATDSNNVDETVKQTEPTQSQPGDETHDSKESALEESPVAESKDKPVVMFTNLFDLK